MPFAAASRTLMDEREGHACRREGGEQEIEACLEDGDFDHQKRRRDEADQTLHSRHGRAVARRRLPTPKWFTPLSRACNALAATSPNAAANGASPSAVATETSR